MKFRTTTRALLSDKAIARMLIHVTASTLGTILISGLAVAAAVRFGGVDPSWKSYALALVLPAILTPVFSIAYVRANYRLHRLQRELKKLEHETPDSVRIEPCFSPVWDTAIVAICLRESGVPEDDPRELPTRANTSPRWPCPRPARNTARCARCFPSHAGAA